MQSGPVVSVIIAAYQARDFIGAAIASALVQDVALEIIVAPDEPRGASDYTDLAARDRRIRVLEGVPAPTGPGPARNRALAAARGDFIALLDADDLWSPDYLARLLPLAEKHGAAFGRTLITDWQGQEIRSVAGKNERADFATFETAFASFHGVTRRDPARAWQDVLAEDVLFDLETLALAGGRAPYADAAIYQLRLRPASLTRDDGFIRNIAAGYEHLMAAIANNATAIAPAYQPAAIEVFRHWAAMNARFEAALSLNSNLDYQTFATRILGGARID
ncbi:glycosyltransferase family 2 protein [Dongia sp.]|uniref:glycosyltransferase family 2 protein n=1 Tax=Dongia sp. TaxID=1977262 RepID=UPI0035B10933